MRAFLHRTLVALALAAGVVGVTASPALADPPDRFVPAAVNLTLQAGQSANVNKVLHLTGLPAKADIIIAIDTTSSMGPAITQAKAEAIQICNAVKAAIPGARFAAVDFEDYPNSPNGTAIDNAYTLLTPGYVADCATFAAAINTMAPDGGGDLAEAYNRVNFEAYSDPVLLASRDPQATRFLVVLGDNYPHSASAFGACPARPPDDLGRNNVPGGGDDLNTAGTIAGLNADDTTLLMIAYDTGPDDVLPCYEAMAGATGGDAVAAGGAGTISAFIISEAAEVPYTVNLAVSAGCLLTIAFSPAPPYGPFSGPSHPTFVETITAPTTPGSYTCTVTAVMSPGGPTTAVQTVTVVVTPGPPATLTLDPPTDVNTAGDTHCVVATVRDQFGNPVPAVPVTFTVSGANTNGGAGVTGATGQAQFCYVGTVAGTDTIRANAAGLTAMASKTWRPAAPATLVLTPPTATNVVGTQHCVTATVRDQFGNATPSVTVRFSVAGSTTTSGSATTNAGGQATFCYTGPALPGADVITAYADTDGDSVRDANEPQATATKQWVLPGSTAGCKVTYGGRITAANGDKGTFGGNAKADGLKGQEQYTDHGPATPMNVHSIDVRAVTCSADGTQASIFGRATIGGAGSFDYRIDLKDLGEPGRNDTYRIRLSNGYDSGEKTLEGGNVQIH